MRSATNTPDDVFVDELLRVAMAGIDAADVTFVRWHHTGPAPVASELNHTELQHNTNQNAAWREASELAVRLRELWRHAWLPSLGSHAEVGFRATTSGGVHVQLRATCPSLDAATIDVAVDRLLTRGWFPDEPRTPQSILLRHGDDELRMEHDDGTDGRPATVVTLRGSPMWSDGESTSNDILTHLQFLPKQIPLENNSR